MISLHAWFLRCEVVIINFMDVNGDGVLRCHILMLLRKLVIGFPCRFEKLQSLEVLIFWCKTA